MSHQFQNRPDATHTQHHHHTQASERDEVVSNQSDSAIPSAANIMRLQSTIGNQAVMRLMTKSNTTSSIQRVKEINDDVVVKGNLKSKEMSAETMFGHKVMGLEGFFNNLRSDGRKVRTEETS